MNKQIEKEMKKALAENIGLMAILKDEMQFLADTIQEEKADWSILATINKVNNSLKDNISFLSGVSFEEIDGLNR